MEESPEAQLMKKWSGQFADALIASPNKVWAEYEVTETGERWGAEVSDVQVVIHDIYGDTDNVGLEFTTTSEPEQSRETVTEAQFQRVERCMKKLEDRISQFFKQRYPDEDFMMSDVCYLEPIRRSFDTCIFLDYRPKQKQQK